MQAGADEEKEDNHEGHLHVHTHATHGHAHGSVIPSEGTELTRHRVIAQVLATYKFIFCSNLSQWFIWIEEFKEKKKNWNLLSRLIAFN